MAKAVVTRCRLCLVTPPSSDPTVFERTLGDALAGGDVASLIITGGPGDPAALQRLAEACVPVARMRGVASFIHNDTRIAGRTGADGVHVDTGVADLSAAVTALRPKRMVGAGGAFSRHDAMAVGEADPDYVFFGRLDGDSDAAIFPKTLDLAEWWAAVTVIPGIVMGGRELRSVVVAAEAGIEFVALSRAVWEHPGGPGAAVAEASALLAAVGENAA
jgi:thiamine-phosphate pyrophosphorylase